MTLVFLCYFDLTPLFILLLIFAVQGIDLEKGGGLLAGIVNTFCLEFYFQPFGSVIFCICIYAKLFSAYAIIDFL